MSDELREKFPDMEPVTAPPALSTAEGFGMMLYGKRGFDPETGTYVKTHVFCFLFVPLLALRAFRVADAPIGWYFLGRVPLSLLAKMWNVVLPLLILGGIGAGYWAYHTNTADYKAEQKLNEADQHAGEGRLEQAAQLYAEVAGGPTSHAYTGQAKLGELLDSPTAQASPEIAAKVVALAVAVEQAGRPVERLLARAEALAKKHAEHKPREALAILDAVAPLERDFKKRMEARRPVAARFLAKHPNDMDALSEMALVHEFDRELDKAEKLLTPHAKKLGQTEGARILGQLYLRKDKLDEAYQLLSEYAADRLTRLQKLQNDMNAARDAQTLQAAQNAFRRDSRVVEVSLDLGILLLRRAPTRANAQERRKELEKAEEHFIAVGGFVGRTGGLADETRLNLGKVKYWLGRHDEGRKIFDEYLEAQAQNTKALCDVAEALREVGAWSEARSLLEQAYEKKGEEGNKFMLAQVRSLLHRDLDDEIVWLKRTNLAHAASKASLKSAEGQKAEQQGKDQEAAALYRESILLWEQVPRGPSRMNNSALVYLHLFHVTGEAEAQKKAVALMEEAVELAPTNSILTFNAAAHIYMASLREVIGHRLDFKVLKTEPNTNMLGFLYRDQATQQEVYDRARASSEFKKARSFFDRYRLFAPRNPLAYAGPLQLARLASDVKALRDIHAALKETSLDLKDENERQLESYQGKKDDKIVSEHQARVERWTGILKEARKTGGVTLAVAIDALVRARMVVDARTKSDKSEELVALADEAYKAAPTFGAEALRIEVLLYRADKLLRNKEPIYAKLAQRARRTLPASYIIAVALFEKGPAHKACLANADVQEVQKLLIDRLKRFPKSTDEWNWAMLVTAHPEHAAKIAENCLKDEAHRLERAIDEKISPLHADKAYRRAWALHMTGQAKEAQAVLRRVAAQGVPLPVELKE